ncbi:hypothetical protein F4604DRAFT_1308269 [Suillus subluteus]|nr:hypothetical protein F4604DRAFT_1308269 [Suillus subluteus]
MTTATRTLDSRWRAPEIVGIERDPEKPSFKSDIYALGGVMFFIISGNVPWKEKNSVQICIALSHKVEHPRPDKILDDHWASIQKCWSWDPENRPDAAEVIECITPKNIIIFGERGAGKSSVINLLAGRQVAETSSGQNSPTLHYDAYGVTIDNVPYRVYDTTGFDDYRTNPSGFLYAITNAHKLAKELREKGGVCLLLYCIKGDRIPPTFITNYRLLYEFLFEEKVPVALIATHLEGEDNMDDWYSRNKGWFECQAVKEKYEMSRTKVGKLISCQAQHWNRGDWSHATVVEEDDPSTGQASKADVLGVLTKRCGLGESLTKVVIRNLYPNMAQSTIRTIPPEIAESTILPPELAARTKHDTTLTSSDATRLPNYSPSRHKTIVLFGETGSGKSSLINLMADEELACTSPGMQWQEYAIHFGGDSYKVFDTVELEEPQLGIKEYLESVENAYILIKELDKRGGIDLLIFCVHAGRVTATMQSNYRLFHEFLCEKKVPIVLAVTNLEREKRMEDWWERNHSSFEKHQIQLAGHACIPTTNRLDGRHRALYEESRITIRNLVQKSTADEQKQAWIGGDNLFTSLLRKQKEFLTGGPNVRKKDLVPYLTKRCGISPDAARQLAKMIRQDVG